MGSLMVDTVEFTDVVVPLTTRFPPIVIPAVVEILLNVTSLAVPTA